MFALGRIVATPDAMAALEEAHDYPFEYIRRHENGDWGDMPPEDVEANRQALLYGGRLMSSYTLSNGTVLWIITEANRSVTTLLLPENY